MKKQPITLIILIIAAFTSINALANMSCIKHMNEGLSLQTRESTQALSKDRDLLRKIENHYQSALLMCPDMCNTHPNMCYNLGIVYQLQGKTDLAERQFQKALAANPKMENANIHLARIYEQKNLQAIALAHYLNAIEIDPQNTKAMQQAKSIAMHHNCKGLGVSNNSVLSETQLYNALACTRIFERAKKRFGMSRAINVSPVDFWSIHFDTGSARLKKNDHLKKVVRMMLHNTDFKLMINGHTDDVPVNRRLEVLPNQYCRDNQCLSEYRAISVKSYLMQQGISGERLQTKGFADKRPYSPGQRNLNRRVEMVDLDYAQ
jgi:flagellar motor protein MotB